MRWLCLLLLGCGGEAIPASDPVDTDPPSLPTDATDPPVCDGSALCARSIDECDVELTQADCESFYESGDCADLDGYTTCNCDCIDEETCDGYFACGQVCFTLFCE